MVKQGTSGTDFDGGCTRCARLVEYLKQSRAKYSDYHADPVSPFGDAAGRLLIVGLAPGLHGANATGRPFTGDHAGIMLYDALYRFGLASNPQSIPGDDLRLFNCRITNAIKCAPPENKPENSEILNCNTYLRAEIRNLANGSVMLALGRIAHDAILRALDSPLVDVKFAHGAEHKLAKHDLWLVDSYHCSRYNTQTGRLTAAMFDAVFKRVCILLENRK